MALTLNFYNRHLALILDICADLLGYDTGKSVRDALAAGGADGETENISILPEELRNCYYRLSKMPEGVMAKPNKQMDEVLLPQLLAGCGLTIEQLQALATAGTFPSGFVPDETQLEFIGATLQIMAIDMENAAQLENHYQSGLSKAGLI